MMRSRLLPSSGRQPRDPARIGAVASVTLTVLACALLVLLLGCAPTGRREDPPVIRQGSELEASLAAQAHTRERPGLRWWTTTGTKSMEPLIVGRVHLVSEATPFEELRVGQVAIYRADWHPASPVAHRLVLRDSYGFIPSGDNVRNSESWMRVTPENYLGRVVAIYTWEGNR